MNKSLQDYVFVSRYSRYLPEKNRRETYNEAVDRVINMHRTHFQNKNIDIEDLLLEVSEAMRNKMVLGSQRAMQFGGDPILKKNARIYNCTTSYCDRPRMFQETLWLLLCGAGVGFSVQKHHINKLPKIQRPRGLGITYTIPDSIEGWSDALGVLLSSYFITDQPFKKYYNKIIQFDYSLIRPKGSIIGSGTGKAPGPEPLKRSLELIRDILHRVASQGPAQLRPIDAYDIIMHTSDAVLSGGVRRCLPYDTLVQIYENKWKRIDELTINDKVYIFRKFYNIKNIFNQGIQQLIKINISVNERGIRTLSFLESTPEHRWYTYDAKENKFGWIMAKDLHKDHGIITDNFNINFVTSTELSKAVLTYDIEIDSEDHAFIAKHPVSQASGISHNSATICLFSIDDDDMIKAKTGNWFIENPQRARSNNSVMLLRDETSKEQFTNIMQSVKEFGEPGFVWTDNLEATFNPCVTGDTMVTTNNGTYPVIDLVGKKFKVVVDGHIFKTLSDGFWLTGHKDVYNLVTKEGFEIRATNNHQFFTSTGWKELKDIEIGDVINLHKHYNLTWGPQTIDEFERAWILGNAVGNGSFVKGSRDIYGYVRYWNDETYLAEKADLFLNKHYNKPLNKALNLNKAIVTLSSVHLYKEAEKFGLNINKTPNTLLERQSSKYYEGFLSGLFDADGYVAGSKGSKSIRLSQTNLALLKVVQRMLLKLGIKSVIYKERHKSGYREMPIGHGGKSLYFCKALHELVISGSSMKIFNERIGFLNIKKQQKLNDIIASYVNKPRDSNMSCIVESKEYIGKENVYDVTVEQVHCFDANGLVAHNCVEVGLYPQIDGQSGFAFCNLSEINMGLVDTPEKYMKAARVASILGTLQADYTSFDYLGEISEKIAKREALLGVSMTGMMENPQIAFDPELQRQAAKVVLDTNEEVSKRIGINMAARTNVVKPSGCLNWTAIVKTNEGNKTLKEIFILNGLDPHQIERDNISDTWYDCVYPLNIINENGEEEAISKLYVNGFDQTYSLKTNDQIIFATDNHKFKINNEWKTVRELIYGNNTIQYMLLKAIPIVKFTVDIETAKTHTYQLSDGTISHNTSSCILGTSSGIHPHHSERYFRRAQTNINEAPAIFYQQFNPKAVENSVWNPNGTDIVITFCVEAGKDAIVKNKVSAVELLERVKITKENWIDHGKRPELCAQPWLSHNVSNTINVKDNEWDAVTNYIYDNRHDFAGISLLSSSGDINFPQAPFCRVLSPSDIIKKYGAGSLIASGLIETGLSAFNNDLWKACDAVLNQDGVDYSVDVEIPSNTHYEIAAIIQKVHLQKRAWINRAKKFAKNYFKNDILMMTYCLKHVHNRKLWEDLSREYVEVDYTLMIENGDNTELSQTIACAGGQCEIL